MPRRPQRPGEAGHPLERGAEGIEARELRADMDRDGNGIDPGQRGGPRVGRGRVVDGDAELVLLAAGGDLVMRLRVDVGVDADRDVHGRALRRGDAGQRLELRQGFDVDLVHTMRDRAFQLGARLADAGIDDALRRHAGRARAAQLAFRYHVGARAEVGQRPDHREIAVGLDRETDQRLQVRHRLRQHPVMPRQGGGRVAIERCAYRVGDARDGDILGMQRAVAILEMVHSGAGYLLGYWSWPGASGGPFLPQAARPPAAARRMQSARTIRLTGTAPSPP